MDDPSPMMRFLPPALCAKSSERALQEETVGLDRLCFHTAFFHVFSAFTGERHKKKHAAIADIAAMLRAFRKQHSVVFSTLPFKLDTKQRWVPDPAQLAPATEAMTTFGRACYSKQTCPFSRSGPKDADFILKTVASVARVSDRISGLWPADLKRTLPMALPAVYHRILDAQWDADTERCKQLSSLVLETSTLACYHLLYLELPKAKRQDPTDGTVRCLFWNAAFFYSQLHAMWDQQLDRLDEAVDRHIQATSDIRAELVDTTCKTMARITAKDTALRKLDAQLQRTPKSDPDARDVLEGKRQELADLNVAAFNFDPKHDIQSELDSVLRIVTFLQMEVRALPLTYPTLVVTSETQGPYKPPRCNAQEPAAAAPQPPASQQIDAMMGEMGNLFQSDDAFWAAQLGDKKKKKRRKNRRGPDELLAALTLEETTVQQIVDEHLAEDMFPLDEERPQEAGEAVLTEAKTEADAARELVATILPGLESILEPSLDCFMCLSPLDFDKDDVRFLTCCAGGSFACGQCVASHPHPVVAEMHVVRMTASIRRNLKLGFERAGV